MVVLIVLCLGVKIFNLVFFPPRFLERDSLSDCAFRWSLPTCTFFPLRKLWIFLWNVNKSKFSDAYGRTVST